MLGIYIHIPFCSKKCNYCDFVSTQIKDTDCVDKYLQALVKELSTLSPVSHLPSTVYIGGGTPSVLSVSQIRFLFSSIKSKVNFSDVCEMTFECNPESVNENKLKVLAECGVNRLSFGAQSFCDDELKFLGRVHSVNDIFRNYALARAAGFKNINIDLIYGLPGQRMQKWLDNLKKAVSLSPEHISLYPLTIEENTNLFRSGIKTSDEIQNRMYFAACDFLEKRGFVHYEISNFARPGYESQHNLNYWRCGEYLGFGASAASHFYNKRWKNTDDINEYCQNPASCKKETEHIDDDKKLSEKVILGLRLLEEGVKITGGVKKRFRDKIEHLCRNKLVTIENKRLKLSKNAVYISNAVMGEFI